MPGLEFIADFSNMEGLRTTLYDPELVPDKVWLQLQHIERAAIQASLPQAQQDHIDAMLHIDDPQTYSITRIDPNLLVGHGWPKHQLFRNNLVAVTFRSNEPISAVLTAETTYAHNIPDSLASIACKTKMLAPMPLASRKRDIHVRAAFTYPDAQPALGSENRGKKRPKKPITVSGITLAGLYYSLRERHERQAVTVCMQAQDPIYRDIAYLAAAIGMQPTDNKRPHTLSGLHETAQPDFLQASVRQIMATILEKPGADVIGRMAVARPKYNGPKGAQKDAREALKACGSKWQREYKARQIFLEEDRETMNGKIT